MPSVAATFAIPRASGPSGSAPGTASKLAPAATRPRPSSGVRRNARDRKSTRLNSSHLVTSYAVFCLKKNKQRYGEPLLSEIKTRSVYLMNLLISERHRHVYKVLHI